MNLDKIYPGGGVYLLKRKGVVIYVGQSKNVRHRVLTHTVKPFDSVEVMICENLRKRRTLEKQQISKLSPQRNGSCDPDSATLRISMKLRDRCKKHAKRLGMKLEFWVDRVLSENLDEFESPLKSSNKP